ncbi:GntR family transcriptional regulator [Dongia soli]|uniref:GntR family transcriptional regulator n=1 Tax=Dongia soli TaxID=600628 RepID=UPI002A6AF383|nr:GntR family transcriptional regulator [Dongia soli]
MDGPVLSKRTMAEQVADLLRQRILLGVLPAGTPIRQEHLATELGISRIPLREALKQLEAEGFVTIASHKGATVAPLSVAEIEELFQLRLHLETWILSLALPRLTEGDFATLDQLIAEQRAPDSLPRWGELNWRFHEVMYRPADRPLTLKMLKRIHDNIDRYLRLEVSLSAGRARAFREHEDLLAHCRKGDVAEALDLLERHIQQTADSLIDHLRARETLTTAD